MAFQPSVDSFGIHRLGVKFSWWHRRQANDTIASERSIFIKNQAFFRVAMNTYVPIFRGLDVHDGRKLRTETQTHTLENYSNPRCAHARRGLTTTHVVIITTLNIYHTVIMHYYLIFMGIIFFFFIYPVNCCGTSASTALASMAGFFCGREQTCCNHKKHFFK